MAVKGGMCRVGISMAGEDLGHRVTDSECCFCPGNHITVYMGINIFFYVYINV